MKDQSELETWAIEVERLDCDADGNNPVAKGSWAAIQKRLQNDKKKNKTGFYAIAASLVSIIMLLHGVQSVNQPGNTTFQDKGSIEIISESKNNPANQQLPGIFTGKENENSGSTNTDSPKKEKIFNLNGYAVKDETLARDSIAFEHTVTAQKQVQVAVSANEQAAATVKHDTDLLEVSQINNLVETIETTPGVTMKPKIIRQYLYLLDKIEAAKNDRLIPEKENIKTPDSTIQN